MSIIRMTILLIISNCFLSSEGQNINSSAAKLSVNGLKISGDTLLPSFKTLNKNLQLLNKKSLSVIPTKPTLKAKKASLKITGTVLYDFLYQSYIDTPFAQNGLTQQTVQGNRSEEHTSEL